MALYYAGTSVGRREGGPRAMRVLGCGITAKGYTHYPGLGEVEHRAERGWLCPGSGRVIYWSPFRP